MSQTWQLRRWRHEAHALETGWQCSLFAAPSVGHSCRNRITTALLVGGGFRPQFAWSSWVMHWVTWRSLAWIIEKFSSCLENSSPWNWSQRCGLYRCVSQSDAADNGRLYIISFLWSFHGLYKLPNLLQCQMNDIFVGTFVEVCQKIITSANCGFRRIWLCRRYHWGTSRQAALETGSLRWTMGRSRDQCQQSVRDGMDCLRLEHHGYPEDTHLDRRHVTFRMLRAQRSPGQRSMQAVY